MNYIINPSWFYWLNVCGQLKEIVTPMLFVTIAIFLILGGLLTLCPDDEWEDKNAKRMCAKIVKVLGCLALVFFALFLLVPSKETLIEMQVAKYATYENAEWTVEAVKGAVDYIVQAIKSVNGG